MAGLPPELPYDVLEPLLLDAVARLQHDLDSTGLDARLVLVPQRGDRRWRLALLRPRRDGEAVSSASLVIDNAGTTYIDSGGSWTRFHDPAHVLPMITRTGIRDIRSYRVRRRWPRCRGRRHLMKLVNEEGECYWVCPETSRRVRVGDLDLRTGHGD